MVVPTITIGLFGGSLADAMDRRKLVLVTTIGQVAVSAALAGQAFAGMSAVWLLYVLVALSSALAAVNQPARRSTSPPGAHSWPACCRRACCRLASR
jgi:ABC-type phosphate transport system permease subunit